MPCMPPMMFVSIVGHASFHTAGRSGPSTRVRSYRRAAGAGGIFAWPAAGAPLADGGLAATSVMLEYGGRDKGEPVSWGERRAHAVVLTKIFRLASKPVWPPVVRHGEHGKITGRHEKNDKVKAFVFAVSFRVSFAVCSVAN